LDIIVIGGLVGTMIIAWALRSQQSFAAEEEERRARQRAQRLGLAPIPGADGNHQTPPDEAQ